jgi:MFS family permease
MRLGGRGLVVLAGATFLLAFGEGLWFQFVPRYLEALGAGVIVVGLWGSLRDALDAAWQWPGGALADRKGPRAALLALTALSLLGLGLVAVPSWPLVLLGLALYMASAAYAQPATFAFLGRLLPASQRARGFGVQSALKRVPLVLAPPIAGWLITTRLGMPDGVRAGVALAALLTALALVAQWKAYAPPAAPAGPGAFRLRDLPRPLRRLLLSDILVRMGESATRVFIVLFVVHQLGRSDLDFALLFALQNLVALAVYWPASALADRGPRKPWVALTFLFFALYPLAFLAAGSWPMLALAFVLGGLREAGEPARKATIVDLAPEAQRGRVVGAYYAIRGLAIMPAAFLAGLLWTLDPTWPFWAGAVLSGAGLLVYVATVRAE